MSKGKVLFVDDDRFWARSYITELQAFGFEVMYSRDANYAVELVENYLDVDAIILDVMMPTPEGVQDDVTEEGLSTGLWVLDRIHDFIASRKICVWILTNRSLPAVLERVDKLTTGASREFITVNKKYEVSSLQLPRYLQEILEKNRP
jgi:CheY-like chemotaxis protein